MIDALIPNKQKRHKPLLIAIVSNRLKNKGKKQRYKNKKHLHKNQALQYRFVFYLFIGGRGKLKQN